MEPLYQSTADCPCCESNFPITRVRPSFKNPSSYDTDFCGYYKNGVNPDFYVIRVCYYCGFSFSENSFEKVLTDKQKKLYFDEIGKHWNQQSFTGERTQEQALVTYKRALMIAQLLNMPDRVIAGYLQHIAWIYRYMKNVDEEMRFLQYALDQYIIVYEHEEGSEKNARLMYLIGELHNRLGNYSDAVKWFSRVVNDKSIMDSGMIRACREQWKSIAEFLAEERKAANAQSSIQN